MKRITSLNCSVCTEQTPADIMQILDQKRWQRFLSRKTEFPNEWMFSFYNLDLTKIKLKGETPVKFRSVLMLAGKHFSIHHQPLPRSEQNSKSEVSAQVFYRAMHSCEHSSELEMCVSGVCWTNSRYVLSILQSYISNLKLLWNLRQYDDKRQPWVKCRILCIKLKETCSTLSLLYDPLANL